MAETEITRDDFIARFKARMIEVAGPDDDGTLATYAEQAGASAWDDPGQREEGPEDSADTDISYWEP